MRAGGKLRGALAFGLVAGLVIVNNRGMKAVFALVLLHGFAGAGLAQTDRQAIEHYRAQFERYLGKDITLMVAQVERRDKGEHGDVAVFWAYTKGERETGWVDVVVPRSESDSFARRYAYRDYRTRPMRGTFMSTTNAKFYIAFKGAEFPSDANFAPTTGAAQASDAVPLKLPAFDDSPMTSFSFDGTRLAEARITEITTAFVRVADKSGASIEVPLERAVKMADLRMRAKDAMDAALAAGASFE